ncbi:MAG: hypothetical protein JWO58_144 [Chitinophagaceae bacterium]|nr:hypothetical protein [Chitinophagaceae bacterium]
MSFIENKLKNQNIQVKILTKIRFIQIPFKRYWISPLKAILLFRIILNN